MRADLRIMAGIGVVVLLSGCAASIDGQARPVPGMAAIASTTPAPGSTGPLTITAVSQIDPSGAQVRIGTTNAVSPAGDGKATCSNVSIAMAGALTGDDAALGVNIRDGAKLAVDEHNSANPGCQVTLKEFDTEGSEQAATQVIPAAIADSSVIGVVGPAFSGESQATGQMFADAGLVQVTASATRPTLADNGWRTFFRGLSSDADQGPALANYATKVLNATTVCSIADSTPYGAGLGNQVRATLGSAGVSACQLDVRKGDKDFSAVVAAVSAAHPDAVIYSGYYAEAAPLVSQLRAAGVTAKFLAGDGVSDPKFISLAGAAAAGAYLSCPCGQGPQSFEKAYAAAYGSEPGVYSAEAFDVATIMLSGIDRGHLDRPAMLSYLQQYNGQGLLRNYSWTSNGELSAPAVWIYQVK